jgi:hypothetical protein
MASGKTIYFITSAREGNKINQFTNTATSQNRRLQTF